MSIRIILAVIIGILTGILFGTDPILGLFTLDSIGKIGYLLIKLLKTLAIPLIFFAIVDAIIRTPLKKKDFFTLLLICTINVSVAIGIGLFIMNQFHPGHIWATQHSQLLQSLTTDIPNTIEKPQEISIIAILSGLVPESIIAPFAKNAVISVVVLALFFGFSLRNITSEGSNLLKSLVETGFKMSMTCIEWTIHWIPYAVFGMVAQIVGKSGIEIFKILWIFLAVILGGLFIHSCIYYPLANWMVGKKSPLEFFKKGSEAIVTGISCNSSLATVPVTLKCLKSLGVSDKSSRLAACIGTNFNNDGIALYEAMAVIFLLQAFGTAPDLSGQLMIAMTAIMAGCGIAGIPEAGLVMLPIVLASAGFPPEMIALAIPLIVPVDWIIARCRSMVNVMADITVGILIDKLSDS